MCRRVYTQQTTLRWLRFLELINVWGGPDSQHKNTETERGLSKRGHSLSLRSPAGLNAPLHHWKQTERERERQEKRKRERGGGTARFLQPLSKTAATVSYIYTEKLLICSKLWAHLWQMCSSSLVWWTCSKSSAQLVLLNFSLNWNVQLFPYNTKKSQYFCLVSKHKYLNLLESRLIYSNITFNLVFL